MRSADDAWAVGGLPVDRGFGSDGSHSVSEHWDGAAWTMVPTAAPRTADSLDSVSFTPVGGVWAVGEAFGSFGTAQLAERWNGTRWVDSPAVLTQNGGMFSGVAVTSTRVWAVGGAFGTNDGGSSGIIERRALRP